MDQQEKFKKYPFFKTKVEWNEFFENLRVQGISVIDNLYQVELTRSEILKKKNHVFKISSLTFTESGDCLLSTLDVTPNRQYDFLKIEENVTVLTTEGWSRTVKYYSQDLLNVEVEGEVALGNLEHVIYKKGRGNEAQFISIGNDGNYYNLVTKEPVETKLIFNDDNTVKDDIVIYNDLNIGCHTCTNNQIKQNNITLVATNLPHFNPTEVWNEVTYDSAKLLFDYYKDKDVTPKDIAQINTRLASFKAPSVPIAPVRTFAIYMGKFTIGMDPDGDDYRDGFGFLSSEYLGESFTDLNPDKYYYAPWACDGLTCQNRCWMNKILAECVTNAYINEFIDQKIKEDPMIKIFRFKRSTFTEKNKQEFYKGILSKGKEGKFANSFVIIYDELINSRKIDILTDLDGLKTIFDPSKPSNLEVLDISHEEHKIMFGSNTSTQLIQSLMVIDPYKTTELMETLADNFINLKKETLMSKKGHAPSWMDFQGNVDYQQVIGKTVPQFAHEQYAPLWHSLVDNSIKSYVKNVRRLNLPTEGAYTKIVPDSAADFCKRLLNVLEDGSIEVVCPVASKHGYTRLIGVKYPKQHVYEFLKGKVITPQEYCERVDSCNLFTEKQKKVLKNHIKHLSGGVMMIPAIPTLKNLLAGADFDGDAVQAFFNALIIQILWDQTPQAIIIDDQDITVKDSFEEAMGDD